MAIAFRLHVANCMNFIQQHTQIKGFPSLLQTQQKNKMSSDKQLHCCLPLAKQEIQYAKSWKHSVCMLKCPCFASGLALLFLSRRITSICQLENLQSSMINSLLTSSIGMLPVFTVSYRQPFDLYNINYMISQKLW